MWMSQKGHAYSLLDVREISNVVIGQQTSITSFLHKQTSVSTNVSQKVTELQTTRRGNINRWTCPTCTFENNNLENKDTSTLKCQICGYSQRNLDLFNGESSSTNSTDRQVIQNDYFKVPKKCKTIAFQAEGRTHKWACKQCTFLNEEVKDTCSMCGYKHQKFRFCLIK